MRNQPKYHFFKNSSYALNGLLDIIKSETSFKIELVLFVLLFPILFFLELLLVEKLLMFITLCGVLIAEVINSAIERAVDLVTLEHHTMAQRAKDAGSSIVFLSICVCVVVWILFLTKAFF